MDEQRRQVYLSGLGIESYMPRWRLPMAPESIACVFQRHPKLNSTSLDRLSVNNVSSISVAQDKSSNFDKAEPALVTDVLRGLDEAKKVNKFLTPLPEAKEPESIDPFSLSVWRPHSDLLVVDARNTKLALPTELLLRNILGAFGGPDVFPGREEIIQWPFIESAAAYSTKEDARNALQVWLEVELERRPVKYLWAFGADAIQYFIPAEISRQDNLWQCLTLSPFSTQAVLLPGLVELLQQPQLKRHLWQCLTRSMSHTYVQ